MTTAGQTPEERAELDALFALALREHRAGRLAEAAASYRRILVLQPDSAGVCNNLGGVLIAQGRLDEAVAQFERAVALQPDFFQVYNNLGNILLSQGKFGEAAARFEKAIALRPDYAEAYSSLGNLLKEQGKFEQAKARFEQSIALRPDYAGGHYNLGILLHQQGKLDEAAARYEQALAFRPDFAEAFNNLGNVLRDQGKLGESAARLEQAIALRPNYAGAHYNLGNTLQQQGKLDEAAVCYEQALALRPDNAEALNNLGNILWTQGKLDEAAARYEQALALRPDYADVHNNLGEVLNRQGKLDLALAHFEQAIALRPDDAKAHNDAGKILAQQGNLDQAVTRFVQALALAPENSQTHSSLGDALNAQGKLDEAVARYQQALALKPDFAEARFGLATCYLAGGDFERGWPAFEARLLKPGFLPPHNLPRWQGEPLAGRSLLLLTEQGLGDTIHFIRYARLLKEQGARVVLACPAALGRLLASYPDLDELFILGSAKELPHCDFCLPLLSVPGALHTSAATIPCDIPYLWADPAPVEKWRQELAAIAGFKIAISWQGARGYSFDRWRSIQLAQFAPLASLPGVRLVSLQKGFGSEQAAKVDFPLVDLSDRLDEAAGPFMDTAAVIRSVDLVVTVNSAVAHLAGALGAPVWVALPSSPDWRWLLDRHDSPWYPTMRLFRQTTFGEWPEVFERIAKAVQAHRTETT